MNRIRIFVNLSLSALFIFAVQRAFATTEQDLGEVVSDSRLAAEKEEEDREMTDAQWVAAETLWAKGSSAVAPVEDLLLPLEHHPDGTVKTILRAESATMPPRGLVRARNVLLESYDENHRLFGIVSAERCLFDQRQNRALCLGRVRLQYKGVRIVGTNVVWMSSEQLIKIYSSAEVRIPRALVDSNTESGP